MKTASPTPSSDVEERCLEGDSARRPGDVHLERPRHLIRNPDESHESLAIGGEPGTARIAGRETGFFRESVELEAGVELVGAEGSGDHVAGPADLTVAAGRGPALELGAGEDLRRGRPAASEDRGGLVGLVARAVDRSPGREGPCDLHDAQVGARIVGPRDDRTGACVRALGEDDGVAGGDSDVLRGDEMGGVDRGADEAAEASEQRVDGQLCRRQALGRSLSGREGATARRQHGLGLARGEQGREQDRRQQSRQAEKADAAAHAHTRPHTTGAHRLRVSVDSPARFGRRTRHLAESSNPCERRTAEGCLSCIRTACPPLKTEGGKSLSPAPRPASIGCLFRRTPRSRGGSGLNLPDVAGPTGPGRPSTGWRSRARESDCLRSRSARRNPCPASGSGPSRPRRRGRPAGCCRG
jgi:hypothetical protein